MAHYDPLLFVAARAESTRGDPVVSEYSILLYSWRPPGGGSGLGAGPFFLGAHVALQFIWAPAVFHISIRREEYRPLPRDPGVVSLTRVGVFDIQLSMHPKGNAEDG